MGEDRGSSTSATESARYKGSVLRHAVPLLIVLLSGLALAHEPWEPTAHRSDAVRWSRAEGAGREVYRHETCWQCHARFVRPLDDEHRRWGPVTWKPGTKLPPDVRGGHRFGPDLARPDAWRSADWLLGYLHDPRALDPYAVMPGYPQLFEPSDAERRREIVELIERFDADGDGRVSFVTDRRPSWDEAPDEVARMAELDVAGLQAPSPEALQTESGMELWFHRSGRRLYADVWRPGEEQGDGILSLRDVRPEPTKRARHLVAYLQRVQEVPPEVALPAVGRAPSKEELRKSGAPLYARHCAVCHGAEGRGDGPAAAYLDAPPTDLVHGHYKYASVLATIVRGLPAAGMPGQPGLRPLQHLALEAHVEGLRKTQPRPMIESGPTPTLQLASEDDWDGYMDHVLRGKAVYVTLGCNTCHGTEGRGDGHDAVAQFTDGRRVRARDLRPRDANDHPRLRFRAGAQPHEVWQTIMAGLDEKGMPGAGEIFIGEKARLGEDGLLSVPLKDERLFRVGVEPYTEEGGYQEVLRKLTRDGFGDDWKLVLYVLHMARTQDAVARRVMAWPLIEVAK